MNTQKVWMIEVSGMWQYMYGTNGNDKFLAYVMGSSGEADKMGTIHTFWKNMTHDSSEQNTTKETYHTSSLHHKWYDELGYESTVTYFQCSLGEIQREKSIK